MPMRVNTVAKSKRLATLELKILLHYSKPRIHDGGVEGFTTNVVRPSVGKTENFLC